MFNYYKTLIYVLDNDKVMTKTVAIILNENGYVNVIQFNNPEELLDNLSDSLRIVILDYVFEQNTDGLAIISKIKKRIPHCYFIMISGIDNFMVLKEFCNTVERGKYIRKENTYEDLSKKLLHFVNECVEDMKLMSEFYLNHMKVLHTTNEIKKILQTDEPYY